MNLHAFRLFLLPLLLLLVGCAVLETTTDEPLVSVTSGSPTTPVPAEKAANQRIPSPPAEPTMPEIPDRNGSPVDPSPVATTEERELAPIVLPIAVYIVDGQAEELSSRRQSEELQAIFKLVNEIWVPAAITLEVQHISRVVLPDDVLQAISRGDFQPFFDGAGRDFAVPDPATINAFYARVIGGPNGIVPFDARLFFVADEPTVHHERVSSHEIGHILGLHHDRFDPGRLMFSGTNGMTLSKEEITDARYTALGILNRQR